jgi:hypothetical protein
MAKHRGFNMCGFKNLSTADHAPYLHCPVHIGNKLIVDKKDPSVLFCPECGDVYQPRELTRETEPISKFGKPGSKMLLQQPDDKKVLRAEDGTPIPQDDEVAKLDLAQGRRIIKYDEYKIEK